MTVMLLRLIALACVCLSLVGFTTAHLPALSLGERLAAPGGVSPLLPRDRIEAMFARLPHREGFVAVNGVPLYWRAIDPGDYGLRYRYAGGTADNRMDFQLDFDASAQPSTQAPRGTVVLLHGWMMDGGSLLPWALELAQAGYRTISVDLRNHGRSGAAPSGYGTREGEDVVAMLRALRGRGEVTGPLHVMGVSYGAATAIFTARDLGVQAGGVVAMESFDNAGSAIRDMVPHMLTRPAANWRDRLALPLARWRYSGDSLDVAIAQADRKLGLDLDKVDVGAALAQAPACVLLIHGDADQHIPVAHGRLLAAASRRARYLEIAGEDHLSLPMRLDRLAPTVIDWFDRTPTATPACPQPLAPGDASRVVSTPAATTVSRG